MAPAGAACLRTLGDNGAGKSTLIKILSGSLEPSAGEIRFDGQSVTFDTPAEAKAQGIETNILHAFQVADRIVVLRHGKVAGERRTAATTHQEIVALVTGDLTDPC